MTREQILLAARQGRVRLVVRSGEVRSKTDGQIHRVRIGDLLNLYNIPGGVRFTMYPSTTNMANGWGDRPGDILLTPRHDGDYSLESAAKRAGVSL